MKTIGRLLQIGALLGLALSSTAMAVSGKFMPPDGKVLPIIGQDCEALGGVESYHSSGNDYFNGIVKDNPQLKPGAFSAYAFLRENVTTVTKWFFFIPYQENRYDYRVTSISSGSCLDRFAASERYSNTALHLSLGIQNVNRQVAEGKFDAAIDKLADYIKRLDRPVYLRIGYEFDNLGHGNLSPYWFRKAWQRIVSRLWANGATNFATVYASMFNEKTVLATPWSYRDYYPGDIYVDWVGFSWWGGSTPDPQKGMMEFARNLGKPVMIAESTPMFAKLDNPNLNAQYWLKNWYQPYFKFINDNSDMVKSFHYISADWTLDRDTFCDPLMPVYWPFCDKNSQVHKNESIRESWTAELGRGNYLHADDQLFYRLGY
ncbi:glycosyl hydrolase [Alcanivorax sp. 1008]|uniref:glycosyl hydrolase n=1 Tax=Alcanivorax sp. 1008 TaxID=2816853 RepID=UPI001DB17275|nr:glycosyl hydrolase [Alcanivorax sp. 1008]MCC1496483.1 hypothetical protein [Alcanivorax sp. 1008]